MFADKWSEQKGHQCVVLLTLLVCSVPKGVGGGGGNGKGWDRRRRIVEIVFIAGRNLIPAAWFPVHSQLIPNLSSAYSLRGSPCFQFQKRNLSDYLCLSLTNAFLLVCGFSPKLSTPGGKNVEIDGTFCLLMSLKRRVRAAHGRIVQSKPTIALKSRETCYILNAKWALFRQYNLKSAKRCIVVKELN